MKQLYIGIFWLVCFGTSAQVVVNNDPVVWNVTLSGASMPGKSAAFAEDMPAPSFDKSRLSIGLDILGFYRVDDDRFFIGSGLSSFASFFQGDLEYNGESIDGDLVERFDLLKLSIPLLGRYDFRIGEQTSISAIAGPAITTYHIQEVRNARLVPSVGIQSLDYVTGVRDRDGDPKIDSEFSPIYIQGEAMLVGVFNQGARIPIRAGIQYHFGRDDVHANRFEILDIITQPEPYVANHELTTSRFGLVIGLGY